jgi:hypothetical protein
MTATTQTAAMAVTVPVFSAQEQLASGGALDYESHPTGLDRNELGSLLVAARLGAAAEHALVSLLALNGLRVSEATGADSSNSPGTRLPDTHDHAQGRQGRRNPPLS